MTSAVFMQMMRHEAFGCERVSNPFGKRAEED
jgi:hypothetical protein